MNKIICFFTLLLFFFLSTEVDSYYFSEDFNGNYTNSNTWEEHINSGLVNFDINKIFLSTVGERNIFPYLRTTHNVFPSSGLFSVEIKFKYSVMDSFGAGITISESPPPYDTNIQTNHKNLYLFAIWQDPARLGFYTTVCPEENSSCDNSLLIMDYLDSPNFDEHVFEVRQDINQKYEIYLDGQNIFSSSDNQPVPSGFWIGNPEINGSIDYWVSFEIDYIHIEDLSSPAEKTPIIILPGFGASWDFEAILNGGNGSDWAIPSFISTYQNLEDSLINAGYDKNVDFFVFTYDWRKNLSSLDDDLDLYINSLISQGLILPEEKIDLVGHSMGGLVARSYVQNIGQEKINKMITLGSPHKGATDTYFAWEGATVIDKPWWQKIAVELLIELNRLPGETQVSTLRRLTPSIKDMLPIYDFLLLEEVLVPWVNLNQKNDYLISINDISNIDTLTRPLVGSGLDTKENIRVVERSWRDRLLGQWEDGKPISGGSFTYATGDGIVLLSSAEGNFSQTTSLHTDHQGLVSNEESLLQIFNELGLDETKIITGAETDQREDVLAVILRSPGEIEVCQNTICNQNLGIYLPESKLFFLPGYGGEEISVKVKENGFGDYSLHIGKIEGDESSWRRISGKLEEEGQEDEYLVKEENGEFVLKVGLEELIQSFSIKAEALNSLTAWDDEGLVDKMIDPNLELKEKLRTARRIRWKLYLLIKENESSDAIVEGAISLWKALDDLMEGLTFNEDFHYLLQCEYWKQVMERHQTEAETEMFEATNYHSIRLWEMGEKRKEEVDLENALIPYSLLMDKINSAEYLFLTAKTIK